MGGWPIHSRSLRISGATMLPASRASPLLHADGSDGGAGWSYYPSGHLRSAQPPAAPRFPLFETGIPRRSPLRVSPHSEVADNDEPPSSPQPRGVSETKKSLSLCRRPLPESAARRRQPGEIAKGVSPWSPGIINLRSRAGPKSPISKNL
jgi:hypothetical protein